MNLISIHYALNNENHEVHATDTDVVIDMHIIVIAFIDECVLIVGSV